MSDHRQVRQEPDDVPIRLVVAAAASALFTFAVGLAWSASVQHDKAGSALDDMAPRPALAGSAEVGMVFQPPFDKTRAADRNEAARKRLESIGWVDRDAGVAHVPIDDAMDLVVKRGRL